MRPQKHRQRKQEEQPLLIQQDQPMERDHTEEPLRDGADICQQLMHRYAKSSAPQHRHLLATAAAMRAILDAESLPLTPFSYFGAAMSAVETTSSLETLDSTEIAALMSFLTIVLPAVPPQGVAPAKAREAVEVLAEVLAREEEKLAVSSVRSAVKCLGILLGFCELGDWNSVKLGFKTLLKFSVDKRPKVRRCAQECLEKVFKCFGSSIVVAKASKLVLSSFESCSCSADWSRTTSPDDGSKDDKLLKSQNIGFLHMLNVLISVCPYLSAKVSIQILSELNKLISPRFSALATHILKIIEALLETLAVGDTSQDIENVVISLASYVSSKENPVDTVMTAANLLRVALNKIQSGGSSSWIKNLPVVLESLAGLLAGEADAASQASSILKDLINEQVNEKTFLMESQSSDDVSEESLETTAISRICIALESALIAHGETPNQHALSVISLLYLKLGKTSYIHMRSVLLKLVHLMTTAGRDASITVHLQRCIGSAVIAMGPEKMLSVVPISLLPDDFSCSNVWLVPILRDYVVGSSIEYYMDYIVPLAKSFKRASSGVKKSVLRKELLGHAHDLWKLLPAFCRGSSDTDKQFGRLAVLVTDFLKKKSFMHESVALALKILVSQNTSVLGYRVVKDLDTCAMQASGLESQTLPIYTKKTASRNIKALSSCSTELLQLLSDLFVDSIPATRSYLKDAIGCLASITDSSSTREIFVSFLKRFGILNNRDEFEGGRDEMDASTDREPGNEHTIDENAKRCLLLELASFLIEGAQKDLIDLVFSFVKDTFQESNDNGHAEAYNALSNILEEHPWFCSSQYSQLIDLLIGLKTPSDTATLRSRFTCFHVLMVHALKMNSEEEQEEKEDSKAFFLLNEIILVLKDAKEESRKEACDVLIHISSSLRSISPVSSVAPYQKLIDMIMGYLSGSSPQITSGAVSALSVLVYKDTDICLSIPDLIPPVLSLLQSKAGEVIKAVLGFVKVVVSCLRNEDLQSLLSDIVDGVISWSSVSRNHFRSKVTVILEIMIRKCGSAAVQLVTPEKYKGFLKTVMENRRNKTSNEGGIANKEASASQKDARGRGYKRRLKNKDASPHSGEYATSLSADGRLEGSNKDGDSAARKFSKIKSNEFGKRRKRTFHELRSGEKRKMELKSSMNVETTKRNHKASRARDGNNAGRKKQKK
ncbi:RRP12-like protein [Rhodamnia argentea]|uniref:RRP12-like protein n=1 Tax=Rhodamnia argentea TaxID=178133 RepID=A0A8B8NU00_9MYRT|nr:RRP12-like protein [Rhodamnia argentea]